MRDAAAAYRRAPAGTTNDVLFADLFTRVFLSVHANIIVLIIRL